MTDAGGHLGLPRGFHDVGPARMALVQALRTQWSDTCSLFGYQAVEVPPVGFAETFTTGHHAADGRFYEFPDRRGRRLALVSDSLPAALRLAAGLDTAEARLSYCCPVFRYVHRPRRYFHHLGLMDVSRRADRSEWAEPSLLRIGKVITTFLAASVPLEITISSPGLWHRVAAECVSPPNRTELVNELRGTEPHRRADLLRGYGASTELLSVVELVAADPTIEELPAMRGSAASAVADAVWACHDLATHLEGDGVDVTVDLGLLHATEFHDTTALLFRTANDHQVLGDGGSYGLFARTFLQADVGVQCAVVGLERLADILSESRPPTSSAAEFAILADGRSRHDAAVICDRLRGAGISVWDQAISRPLRHHLRDLADLGIPASTIIGGREQDAQILQIRCSDGSIVPVGIEDLPAWLKARRETGAPRGRVIQPRAAEVVGAE